VSRRKPSAAPKAEPWLKTLGGNLRGVRRAAGLTQEQLAEKADLAPRTLQTIEAGSITILVTTLRRLKTAIGCEYDQLLKEEEINR
jgi:transcriptional regulator with XRE-family HTH domain